MSKDRREYMREYRKKNLERLRENEKKRKRKSRTKDGRQTLKKIDTGGHGLTDGIVRDLAYKIPQGLPDLRNHHHISILRDVLKSHGWNDEAVKVYISELLLPIRVGQKIYEEILEERERDNRQHEIWELISGVLKNGRLDLENHEEWSNEQWKQYLRIGEDLELISDENEYLNSGSAESYDIVKQEVEGVVNYWTEKHNGKTIWKYCPHCGKEIDHE